MSIYVEFGEPLDKNCQATSASLGTTSPPIAGGISHRAQSKDFSFTKTRDSLSPELSKHMVQGTRFGTVVIEFYKNDETLYAVYTMSDVMIASWQSSGESEGIGLNFGGISTKYYG
ncbi:hypothetical protein DWF00_17185 [Bosea caraganae]|uniref:Phage tail protein n=1 Tax=Bosea caraganae TaxID=2763117 RepID=A0A370L7P1_9HYPH|nr:type VI secretion system tube protein Hcp [Bosea caraganae]RDJ24946.1 hypothetical protein DWF00_17185 [Bosea caraganae]RDJ26057.1 hypothetical protein DWE98_09405 [Bosea caraganae]